MFQWILLATRLWSSLHQDGMARLALGVCCSTEYHHLPHTSAAATPTTVVLLPVLILLLLVLLLLTGEHLEVQNKKHRSIVDAQPQCTLPSWLILGRHEPVNDVSVPRRAPETCSLCALLDRRHWMLRWQPLSAAAKELFGQRAWRFCDSALSLEVVLCFTAFLSLSGLLRSSRSHRTGIFGIHRRFLPGHACREVLVCWRYANCNNRTGTGAGETL